MCGALAEEWQKGVALEEEYAELGEKKAEAVAVDTTIALAKLHHTEAAPKINPTHVERPWVLDVDGLGIQLAGTIDIQEGTKAIRDTKTSKKSPAADAAHTSLQLTTYALAVRQIDGKCPERVGLDYLVHTKTPKLVQIEGTRSEADFPHLLERVYQASRIIEAGLFMPASFDGWWCAPKWCGFYGTCKYAARPVSVAA
jgi:RecB family exonuclease